MFFRVFHVLLSLILVILSSGFTITQHFCKERLVHVGIYVDAESCSPDNDIPCCNLTDSRHCSDQNTASDCCRNQSKYIRLTELFIHKVEKTQPIADDGFADLTPLQLFPPVKDVHFTSLAFYTAWVFTELPVLFCRLLL